MSSPPRYRSPRLQRPSTSSSSTPGVGGLVQNSAAGAAAAAAAAAASPPSAPEDVADADAGATNDEDGGGGGDDIPLTMTASVMLSQLPRDATAALADAGAFPAGLKVVVRFKPVGGSAPALRQELSKISASQRFDSVVLYLRRRLQVAPTESVFLYINSTFAPALDEIVGNLHRCFKDSNGQLNVAYSMTPAFG
ncbi:hypothetical protein GGTG_00129 [Gaeumannomyces tritici R3-111a-1]|uniref:Ubiquitin-like protein ATG12 n=1 Tax=Gaeumannomyces tritici (strain R3-111a-1) TaxID=644352 RepID=J3NFT5_GAET3|nr:hypothetical protein GGTG_00129 [Gaeumannomyces tritici R3-111a-1]EJT80125.1 hypothetical protein GGTG_00129 [Gaeumannomyces tritici R3-111a-1]